MGEPGAFRPGTRSMAVLYGTETGNAEEIAVELGKMAQRLHFETTVDEMDGFKLADVLRKTLVIFVTSTTGQGEMPKNTRKFWKNLRREKLNNTNCLGSLRFAIFGLGDSSYLKFNWAARKLRARLLQLGASELLRPGEGDERHDNSIDSIYLPWYQELKTGLIANYPLPQSVSPIPDDVQLPPKYPLRLLSTMDIEADDDNRFLSAACSHVDHPKPAAEQVQEHRERMNVTFPSQLARQDEVWEHINNRTVESLDKDNILRDHPEKYLLTRDIPPENVQLPPDDLLPIRDTYLGTVVENSRMTPADHWQDVRHIAFNVSFKADDLEWIGEDAGHLTLVIYPKNYPEDVDELIRLMDWGDVADELFAITMAPRGLHVKKGTVTLRFLLTHNLDITAVPKRNFIKELVFFTNDEREKERLGELTMPGNEQEFYDYTCRPRRTILELLRDFPGVKIPTDRVLDLFQVIRGREFSVCNAGMAFDVDQLNALRIEILAALVEYKTIIRKPRQGLCSRYLKHLPVGTKLRVGLKVSSGPNPVKDDTAASRPLIAIATGTGIAPIRAIIQERASYEEQGYAMLFFGCRNRDADYHFGNEWADHPNVLVFPAFSCDGIAPDPKTVSVAAAAAAAEEEGTLPADSALATKRTTTTTTTTSATEPGPIPIPKPIRPRPVVEYDADKNYVQHLIRAHAREVGVMMRRRPIVCICGNAGRMPLSVRAALLDALVLSGVCHDREAAEKWFANEKKVTVWQETW